MVLLLVDGRAGLQPGDEALVAHSEPKANLFIWSLIRSTVSAKTLPPATSINWVSSRSILLRPRTTGVSGSSSPQYLSRIPAILKQMRRFAKARVSGWRLSDAPMWANRRWLTGSWERNASSCSTSPEQHGTVFISITSAAGDSTR